MKIPTSNIQRPEKLQASSSGAEISRAGGDLGNSGCLGSGGGRSRRSVAINGRLTSFKKLLRGRELRVERGNGQGGCLPTGTEGGLTW